MDLLREVVFAEMELDQECIVSEMSRQKCMEVETSFQGRQGEDLGCLLSMDLQSAPSRVLLSLLACMQDLLILAGMLLLRGDLLDGSVIPTLVVVVDESSDQLLQVVKAEDVLNLLDGRLDLSFAMQTLFPSLPIETGCGCLNLPLLGGPL